MRTRQVATHFQCNQNCGYCTWRRGADEPAFVQTAAVTRRSAAAIEAGAQQVVFTGGEPLMRADLVTLVERAKRAGVEVRVDTNATLLTPAFAAALRTAGLDRLRVNLTGWGEQYDALTRDPGGFERACAGIDAGLHAGLQVELSVAVVQPVVGDMHQWPRRWAERFSDPGIRAVYIVMPTQSAEPEAAMLVDATTAADAIALFEREARARGIAVKLAQGSGPPPCAFRRDVPAHLYSMTPGGATRDDHERVDACGTCTVADRCPGYPSEYLRRFGVPEVRPVGSDRVRRRLSLIGSVDEQIERELVSPSLFRGHDGQAIPEEIIRVNFRCNQRCRFCFVSTHLPSADDERIFEAIRAAGQRGARIVISGGEPTLNPRIEEFVRLSAQLSNGRVQLQTNAIRFDDVALTQTLVNAGLAEAFVSLHGSTAAVCDAITGAPGTFERSVVGIDHLVTAGVEVALNFVICTSNATDLPAWIALVARRWPGVLANVSFVAPSTDVVPRDAEMIPRYEDVLPHLRQAILDAHRLNVQVVGFESMCGLPLCLVPDDLKSFRETAAAPEGYDDGEFEKPEPCQRCSLRAQCFGIRRGYAALYGVGELRPVAPSRTTQPDGA